MNLTRLTDVSSQCSGSEAVCPAAVLELFGQGEVIILVDLGHHVLNTLLDEVLSEHYERDHRTDTKTR